MVTGEAAEGMAVSGPRARPADHRPPVRTAPVRRQQRTQGSASASPCIRCGTASPPICWSRRSTSASSRRCSATGSSTRQRPRRLQDDPRRRKPRSRCSPRRPRRHDAAGVAAPRLEVAGRSSVVMGRRMFRPRRPSEPRPTQGRLGDPSLPHRGARRPCRALPRLRLCRDRLRLVPRPALPEVPGAAHAPGSRTHQADLLPVAYYHVVFTLPATIAAIALQNKAAVYDLLMKAAAETLTTIAADPKRLGVRIGFTSVLHTWGSALTHHPHVHIIVPGGGLSPDGSRWIACWPRFFLPVRVLSRFFRRRLLEGLLALHEARRLTFFGDLAELAGRDAFTARLAPLRRAEWVVYAKRRSASPTLPVDEFMWLGRDNPSSGMRHGDHRRRRDGCLRWRHVGCSATGRRVRRRWS